jgi:hypothetical protein
MYHICMQTQSVWTILSGFKSLIPNENKYVIRTNALHCIIFLPGTSPADTTSMHVFVDYRTCQQEHLWAPTLHQSLQSCLHMFHDSIQRHALPSWYILTESIDGCQRHPVWIVNHQMYCFLIKHIRWFFLKDIWRFTLWAKKAAHVHFVAVCELL